MSKELVAKEAKQREIMRRHPVPGKILSEFVIPAKEAAALVAAPAIKALSPELPEAPAPVARPVIVRRSGA